MAEFDETKAKPHAHAPLPAGSRFMGVAETAYSKQVAQMAQHYAARMPDKSAIIALDPDTLDVLRASGHSARASIALLLTEGGRPRVAGETLSELEPLIADEEEGTVHFGEGLKAFPPQSTAAAAYGSKELAACLVVPASHGVYNLPIKALSPDDAASFVNRHEFWHCLDQKYQKVMYFAPWMLERDPEKRQEVAMASPGHRQYMSAGLKKETFADLGAVGDMIVHDGKTTDVIAVVSQFRLEHSTKDIEHFSSPALDALKAHIDKTGVAAFKAMSDADRVSLYYDLTDRHTVSGLGIAAHHHLMVSKKIGVEDLQDAAKADPDVARFLKIYDGYLKPGAKPATVPLDTRAPQADEAVTRQVLDWDAAGELQARARDPGSLGLYQARTAMTDELRAQVKAEPESALHPAKLAKLRQAFKEAVSWDPSRAVPPVEPEKLFQAPAPKL